MAYAQIGTRDLPGSASAAPVADVNKYDSLYGVVAEKNLKMYIGQEVFFLPKQHTPEVKLTYTAAYSNIYTSLPNGYKFQNRDNTYKPVVDGTSAHTLYDAVAGKYFTILEMIDKTEVSVSKGNGLYLKMKQRDNGDIVYFDLGRYNTYEQAERTEYILAGAFAKLQQVYLNKTFYTRNRLELVDANTGKAVTVNSGEELICTDVTLTTEGDYSRYLPSLIFKTKAGVEVVDRKTAYIDITKYSRIYMPKAEKDSLDKEKEAQDEIAAVKDKANAEQNAKDLAQRKADMIRKYGEKYGALIAENKVAIGMTKTMCVSAWGQPSDVNSTTTAYGTRDQYVYRDRGSYLYFEGDKLVTIQK